MRANQSSEQHKIDRQVFPFYPILFGIYPVLALAAYNITEIDFPLTYRAFAASFVLAVLLFFFLRLVKKNWMKAALLALLLLILFFSYGHVYNLLKNPANPFPGLVRHRILGLVWFGLAGLSFWYTTMKIANLASITTTLNIIAVILLVYPAFQIGQFVAKNHPHTSAASNSISTTISQQVSKSYPDIYYIILDGYMRADDIKVVYGFDNTAFIDALIKRGFDIPKCSQSNYAHTKTSFASSLNMNYMDVLGASKDDDAISLFKNSSVRIFLKNRGYKVVAFETGFPWSQWQDADVYYKYVPRHFQLNGFESLFLRTTLVRIPLDNFSLDNPVQEGSTSDDALHHDLIIANLNLLKEVPIKVKGPKFVFAHLTIPHPPYVFRPNGDFVPEGPLKQDFIYDLTTPPADKPGYTNALLFINSAILKVVDNILADSKIPPVIIIQGDHGAFRFNKPEQRLSILNAYYLPNKAAKDSLYPSITPVNTFRILFDAYFGQNLPLLPDVSRYSPPKSRWSFEIVPNQCH